MKILAPSSKVLESLFPEAQYTEIPKAPEFTAFQWDDLTCASPLCFEVYGAEFERVFDFHGLGILEEYSGSSQFDRLRNWHGPAVFALAINGKGFHGQHDREWWTEAGNLHLSMAFPVDFSVTEAENVQLLPAHIIKDMIASMMGEASAMSTEIKLPNDVVIHFKSGAQAGKSFKIAGTLTEMRVLGERITQVRYGIGMNILHAPNFTDFGHFPAIALQSFANFGSSEFNRLYFFTALLRGVVDRLMNNG